MKRIIGIIISLITLLFVTAILCACGNSDRENAPSQLKYYTVSFEVDPMNGGGYIEGKTSQTIKEGDSTEKITAIAEYGYYFAGWIGLGEYSTDESVVRIDKVIENVTENLHVVVLFDKITLTVSYASDKNGYIDGVSEQSVKYGEASESVTAMPNVGYMFKEWSDGVKTATRNESELKENKTLTASFELLTNVYTYEYKFADGNCDNKDVALTYGQLDSVKLAVPTREHAQFAGWYADKLLKTQVSDCDGNIITDDRLLYTDCNTLYAKWIGKNTHQYKILLVYVTELNADIMKRDGSGRVKVQYKMSETERKICHMLTERFAFELNDLAVADFVVDEFYTTEPLGDKQVDLERKPTTGHYCSEIMPNSIAEVKDKYLEYDSVLSSFSFGDYSNLLIDDGGSGSAKYGCIHFDEKLVSGVYYNIPFHVSFIAADMERLFDPAYIGWGELLRTYWHELAHTIEQRVYGLFDFHEAHSLVDFDWRDPNKGNKSYFLNKIESDGSVIGIPYEFWEGKVAKLHYSLTPRGVGWIVAEKHINLLLEGNVVVNDIAQYIIYGNDGVAVTAIVHDNDYEFVAWSDGVTTATRQDKNISGNMYVYAILKKKEDTK